MLDYWLIPCCSIFTDTPSVPFSILAELKKQNVELYIELLREEFITLENDTVKKCGNVVNTLSVNALKPFFNYLTKENANGESYFYRNVMSKIVLRKKISTVVLNE